MATVNVTSTVKAVSVFTEQKFPDVRIVLNDSFKGFMKNKDGTYEEADVNHFSLKMFDVIKQLRKIDDLFDEYCVAVGRVEDRAIRLALTNAKLTFARELVAAGEPMLDSAGEPVLDQNGEPRVYERDTYKTSLVKIEMCPRAIKRLDAACAL